jgi:hypothetical protein
MEPLDDKELSELLRRWQTPAAPAGLSRRFLPPRKPWLRWLLTGTIRIPVPVGVVLVVLAAVLIYSTISNRRPVAAPAAGSVSLADFHPVQQLEPRIIRGQQ